MATRSVGSCIATPRSLGPDASTARRLGTRSQGRADRESEGASPMTNVIADISMSLDGFVTGPGARSRHTAWGDGGEAAPHLGDRQRRRGRYPGTASDGHGSIRRRRDGAAPVRHRGRTARLERRDGIRRRTSRQRRRFFVVTPLRFPLTCGSTMRFTFVRRPTGSRPRSNTARAAGRGQGRGRHGRRRRHPTVRRRRLRGRTPSSSLRRSCSAAARHCSRVPAVISWCSSPCGFPRPPPT